MRYGGVVGCVVRTRVLRSDGRLGARNAQGNDDEDSTYDGCG